MGSKFVSKSSSAHGRREIKSTILILFTEKSSDSKSLSSRGLVVPISVISMSLDKTSPARISPRDRGVAL
jgi:hypothetical protein